MKQCMKLGIIVILAALLHYDAIEAADFLYTPAAGKTERCSLSQAPASQRSVRTLYASLFTSSFCVNHAESMQIPDNRSALLLVHPFRMQLHARSPEYGHMLCPAPPPAPDIRYYIFGLRKILI